MVASLLDAAGILVHIGGYNHSSVSICPVALGGFKLTVPEFQHQDASGIIASAPGFGEETFSYALQRAVIKVMILWSCIFGLPMVIATIAIEDFPPVTILVAPLMVITVPVNPQGNSDYYLSALDDA